jgi:protein Mpv17
MRLYDHRPCFLLLFGITTVSSLILGKNVQASTLVRTTTTSDSSSAARDSGRYSFPLPYIPHPRIPSFHRQSSQSIPFTTETINSEKKKKQTPPSIGSTEEKTDTDTKKIQVQQQQLTPLLSIDRFKSIVPLVGGSSSSSVVAKTTFIAMMIATLVGYIVTSTSLIRYSGLFLQNGLFNPYQNLLVIHPLQTKVGTGAILAVVGDAVAQKVTQKGQHQQDSSFATYWDKRRALSFAVFDMCYRVFQHNMFPFVIRLGQGNVIKKVLPQILPSKNLVSFLLPAAAAIEQTAIYQLAVVPCLYYPFFFAFTGVIQGLTFPESLDRMKSQFFRCWRRNLMFWIPTQLFLFGVVDEKFQIPFACVMGMIWSSILSLTAGKTSHIKN